MALSLYRRPVPKRRSIMSFSSWLRKLRFAGHRRPTRGPRPALRFRPQLEALEDRIVPSQVGLTVTSLADSGPGTLRAAIQSADAGSHTDTYAIGFAVAGTIDLQSSLPELTNSIAIQGPGAASLTIERDANLSSFPAAILTVDAGQTASLSGLTIANGNADPGFSIGGGITNAGTLTVANCA